MSYLESHKKLCKEINDFLEEKYATGEYECLDQGFIHSWSMVIEHLPENEIWEWEKYVKHGVAPSSVIGHGEILIRSTRLYAGLEGDDD